MGDNPEQMHATFNALVCSIHRMRDRIVTVYPDGSSTSNWPPSDAAFAETAGLCGFQRLMDYLWEHELCHTLVPLRLFGHAGYVSRMAAAGEPLDPAAAAAEERLIYYVQRYVAGAIPCIDPQWDVIRDELLVQRGR